MRDTKQLGKVALVGLLAFGAQRAIAAPVLLLCSANSVERRGLSVPSDRSYQVSFDDGTFTISVDGGPPLKAEIGRTMINWRAPDGVLLGHIDRLTGRFRISEPNSQADFSGGTPYEYVAGICTAPPPRKF